MAFICAAFCLFIIFLVEKLIMEMKRDTESFLQSTLIGLRLN